MDTKTIVIAYAGSLGYFSGAGELHCRFISLIKDWFWTYRNNHSVNKDTRSPYYLFKAVSELAAEGKLFVTDLQINLWGAIDKRNFALAQSLHIEQFVTFEGHLSKNKSLAKLSEAHVLFLPLESARSGTEPLFIPGKIFDYLRLEKPILLLAQNSDCVKLGVPSGLCIICEPSDIREIKQTLMGIITRNIDLNCLTANKEYVQSKSFRAKTKELSDVFDEVLSK